VLWLNIGDSYAASGKGGGGKLMLARGHKWEHRKHLKGWRSPPPGYTETELVGVPWMLAFALRLRGWYLRRDVVWNKTAATEPTRADRPSGSHEMLFLLSKQRRYAFDPSPLPHGTVWSVKPLGYEGHSAAYPPSLIEPCILAGCPVGGTVLDPFGGAGTTGLVADRLQRNAILIELNPESASLAQRRIHGDSPLFVQTEAA
jgi:site-specific DNA-methyltransferase (cytosine-N4-specific)